MASKPRKHIGFTVLALCCAAAVLPLRSEAQAPASAPSPRSQQQVGETPGSNLTVDGSEAMFATMCALLASGFESDVSTEHWQPLRIQLRERMQHQQGPAVEALRTFYKQHQLADPGAMLSQYIWFGLVSGPAPKFQPTLRRDELPPEVLALEGFSEILSAYYQEQNIGALWRQVQPNYNREIVQLHEAISQIVFVATNYLRVIPEIGTQRTFTVIVEPLVGRITNVRNFGDHYVVVLSGSDNLPGDVIRHAYLHFLLDSLPLQYPHIVAAKRTVFGVAAPAPRLESDLKDDFPSYFSECLVRAVELKLKPKRMSPSEIEAALSFNDADGYVLVRPLYQGLGNFEKSEPSIKLYFPELVRQIDAAAETKRAQTVKFAPAETAPKVDVATTEAVVRHRAPPSTMPDDPAVIAALTEGEKHIAEKNPRAAEASFQKVLAKYPEQPRALYGLGLVALIDHDGVRAKEVFGKLTNGEHAATQDPMVLAWSHVYLARIYDDEGHANEARTEYQAALAVDGGPERARQAAQKGLAEAKAPERP